MTDCWLSPRVVVKRSLQPNNAGVLTHCLDGPRSSVARTDVLRSIPYSGIVVTTNRSELAGHVAGCVNQGELVLVSNRLLKAPRVLGRPAASAPRSFMHWEWGSQRLGEVSRMS